MEPGSAEYQELYEHILATYAPAFYVASRSSKPEYLIERGALDEFLDAETAMANVADLMLADGIQERREVVGDVCLDRGHRLWLGSCG